ncbi:hypothetical protein AB0J83_01765 [Actinoplanes sp. NPDC049596]|uniref:hypothetical protein n=1 Tax=unclassified Actinoplanes TaxID=2626549 RepID=UPI00344738C6
MILGLVVVTALLVGFLAGLVSFKKTNEYCDRHGVTRLCPLCPSPDAAGHLGSEHHLEAGRLSKGASGRPAHTGARPRPA